MKIFIFCVFSRKTSTSVTANLVCMELHVLIKWMILCANALKDGLVNCATRILTFVESILVKIMEGARVYKMLSSAGCYFFIFLISNLLLLTNSHHLFYFFFVPTFSLSYIHHYLIFTSYTILFYYYCNRLDSFLLPFIISFSPSLFLSFSHSFDFIIFTINFPSIFLNSKNTSNCKMRKGVLFLNF